MKEAGIEPEERLEENCAAVKRETASHYPGYHSNVPAHHSSIFPELRDRSLFDGEEAGERSTEKEQAY
ncbi:hypothetical protein PBY51_013731 [Eleginops maclovinus]|uniref:Uncharacterized protein n=1 Tax=Eleginops maclovinus TaxID=56733 RepID=A0AAN8AXX4_ELEMC|nr:hypothetical protein PBY51_013731 [Eleginops maclovinus]